MADRQTKERAARRAALEDAVAERILLLDGALGTEIQALKLAEEDYRGTRLSDHGKELKGNNDLLCLTRPEAIRGIHRAYFEAGTDIATTNSFNATRISQGEYGTEHLAFEINREAARLARAAADETTARTPEKPRFVAGVLGPTSRTCSISPDVNDPAHRNVTYDELRENYREAADGLVEGGADLLLVETVFDTLNARAALFALEELFEDLGERLPVMISGTITDRSGRTLSGQTPEAFWISVAHARPFSVGLNCALGPEDLRAHVEALSRVAEAHLTAHPNAGLPNAFGGYDLTPEQMAAHLEDWAREGLVNVLGGCCGTTPAHIAALAEAVAGLPPRRVPKHPPRLRLSGLEPFELHP